MLKIKDSIDLKELEKFGFCKCTDSFYSIYLEVDSVELIIENRMLWLNTEHGCLENLGVIFDLIQAGLVEKVES